MSASTACSSRRSWLLILVIEAKEEITPDSTKSTQDKVKETVTDTSDRFARGLQTDDSKSTGQEAFDKTQRSHDNAAHGGASNNLYGIDPQRYQATLLTRISSGDKVKGALGLGNN